MITITVLGIDPYLGRQLSRELTEKLADIYETEPENIYFNVPETFFIWNGVEQNQWNILVRVNAPVDFSQFQEDVARIIHDFLVNITVHCSIEFYYYYSENRYDFIDESHPRFMTEDNVVYDDYDEEDTVNEGEGDEPYLGNIFKGLDL